MRQVSIIALAETPKGRKIWITREGIRTDYLFQNKKMRMFIYIQIISFIFLSCGTNEQRKIENTDNVVIENATLINKDTTIVYDIEGISAEGTEAITKYVNGKIKESTISVYGETGQAKIVFVFSPNQINVTEKEFAYKEDLKSIKSESDMKLKKEITYIVDYNGVPIGNADKERLDIFQEFKKVVPFELK